jgi:hypothetical protein
MPSSSREVNAKELPVNLSVGLIAFAPEVEIVTPDGW